MTLFRSLSSEIFFGPTERYRPGNESRKLTKTESRKITDSKFVPVSEGDLPGYVFSLPGIGSKQLKVMLSMLPPVVAKCYIYNIFIVQVNGSVTFLVVVPSFMPHS